MTKINPSFMSFDLIESLKSLIFLKLAILFI